MTTHKCNKEAEIATLVTDVGYIKKTLDSFLSDHKKNNEFRQQAKGIIGAIAFTCTGAGAGIFYLVNWLVGGK